MAKQDPNAFVTNKTLQEAVDGIMGGIDRIIDEVRMEFKYITKNFATKEDIKREVSWLRDDIKGLKADLSDTVSRREFTQLQSKVDKYLVA